MNYAAITALALAYSDRPNDTEVLANIDNFLLIVESRINRAFKVGDMSARATIDLTLAATDQEYFGLPADFGGLRDLEYNNGGGSRATFHYINPEQMNAYHTDNRTETLLYYTLVANQIQIYPVSSGVGTLEIVYYQRVPPLSGALTNWLGDDNPDCYVFGLMVEISAFTKDKEAAALWDIRFKESLAEIDNDDTSERWSGTPLQTRVG